MAYAAIVVTYNSAAVLARCVRSLWSSGVQQVVVVDNASADDSVGVAQRLGVLCVRLPQNVGFAAACNIGARFVAAPYLFFVNPDALVQPAALVRAGEHFRRAAVGAVGLRLIGPDGAVERGSFGPPVTLWQLVRRRRPSVVPTSEREVGWVSGGAMLVRRAAFQAVGGFSERYFLYWEDVDLCRRLQVQGWRVIFEPRAQVVHDRGASLSDLARKTVLYDTAADIYFQTHYATPIWLLQRSLRRLYRLVSPRVR